MNAGWRGAVINAKSKEVDRPGYTLCTMDSLQAYLRSRDIFIEQSERWCDPRAKLLKDDSWEKNKSPVCRSLNLSTDFDEVFGFLSAKIDKLLPVMDFPELLLEVDRMTNFTEDCTHISDMGSRISEISVSLCAVFMADSCNIGLESIINEDIPHYVVIKVVFHLISQIENFTIICYHI